MKRYKTFILTLLIPLGLWAQGQGLQVALKGGVSQWKGKDARSTMAPMGGWDLSYIIRCNVSNTTLMGLRTGLGISYTTAQLSATLSDSYERVDYYSNTLQYSTTASAQERHQQLQLDLPILFALQTHGFALNIGPKLFWLALDKYTQTVDQATIDAYYPNYKVTVHNEPATGYLPTPYTGTGTKGLPSLSVAFTAELGYEWRLGDRYSRYSEQYIGVQLYVDYGLWSLKSKQEAFLSVAPITAAKQTPAVTVGTIAAATSLQALNAGLRLYYTIQSVDYPGRGWHHYRR